MGDPRRLKHLGKIIAKVRLDRTAEILNIHALVDKEILKNTPPDMLENALKLQLKKISDKPHTTIYNMSSSFSYSQKDAMKDFDFGNVLVEAHLPYCFHIPNHIELLVSIPEYKLKASVILEKIWTFRAQTDEEKSDIIDFYTDKSPLYLKNCTVLGPKIPLNPEAGWEQYITGKNIEKINDQNGLFRYSRTYIQLNINLPENIDALPSKSRDKLFKEIHDKSLQVVNRIIDNYREITKEIHVRRLGKISINLIYFNSQNTGYYMSKVDVTGAMINRSYKEIKELKSKLTSGTKPELYRLLLLNAKNSLESNDYTLAIVESFQSLEIFLENYLITEFRKQGEKEKDYKPILEKQWRTKNRLNGVLKQLKGISLNKQTNIWNKWCLHYDKTRNEVIHSGKEPNEKETKETLEINEKVISWILSL